MSDKVYRIKPLKWTEMGIMGYLAQSGVGAFVVRCCKDSRKWSVQDNAIFRREDCDLMEHGKQLAQSWYEERMAAGLEEVPMITEEQLKDELEIELLGNWQRAIQLVKNAGRRAKQEKPSE